MNSQLSMISYTFLDSSIGLSDNNNLPIQTEHALL